MSVPFSSSEKAAIDRQVDAADIDYGHVENVSVVFEVDRCVQWIKDNNLERVALQFPDHLISHSPIVAQSIEHNLEQRVYILGDTSYGECCVDEVAAEHISADGIIHFGHACLTPTQRIPALYVFTVLPVDCDKLVVDLQKFFESSEILESVAIVYDVQYHKAFSAVEWPKNFHICVPHPPKDNSSENSSTTTVIECGREWPQDIVNSGSKWNIVYVGMNDNFDCLLRFTFVNHTHYKYDPRQKSLCAEGANVTKKLMKRYFMVEKTKDADRIGILVGTLGASRYGAIIDKIRETIAISGKKCYTFLVGKPNVPKLANFPEIDVFVLVACPENSLLSSRDFLKPIITPFELDVALNSSREWTGDFYANFKDLLPEGKAYEEFIQQSNNEYGDISLITGKVRTTREVAENKKDKDFALTVQDRRITSIHQNGGGEFLSQRSWQGLEQRLGETKPELAKEGQKGIAWGYENEGNNT